VEQISISETRRQIARLVEQVEHRRESFVITRHGKPAAALVPMDVYEEWQRERRALFDVIRDVQRANPDADPDAVVEEVIAAQQAIRRKRAAEG